ncbi:hypothetical protein RB597_005932 [Gaeumannomyces tritici]
MASGTPSPSPSPSDARAYARAVATNNLCGDFVRAARAMDYAIPLPEGQLTTFTRSKPGRPPAPVHVLCETLDLDESQPRPPAADDNNGDFLFVRPIPPATMDSWLQEVQPCASSVFGQMCQRDQGDRPIDFAESLIAHLDRWLSCDKGDLRPDGPGFDKRGLFGKTKWRTTKIRHPWFGPTEEEILKGCYYMATYRFDYGATRRTATSPRGFTETPHIVGTCAHSVQQLPEQGLLRGEIDAIIIMTQVRRMPPCCVSFRAVPVTVISVARNDVRILHAYVDTQKRLIKVRKSRVLNFDNIDDIHAGNDEWKHILRWVLAEPDMDTVRATGYFDVDQPGSKAQQPSLLRKALAHR